MIKKLFTGILIGILALWAFYLYFLYVWDTTILWSWIQAHQLYTAIFFVSLILLYMLQWGNKLFKFLIFIIILINLFILWDVFFRNNIWLNSGQFITLFGLIIVALAVTYITHRVRYIFMGIIGLGIAFILLTWTLPLYADMPSIGDFIQSQKTKIINQWASEWTLIIKNALGTREIPIKELSKSNIDLSQKTQISFASKVGTELEKVFIDLWNGSFININPQSAVTLEQSWGKTVMQILQGNIQYYTPSEFSWALQLIGKYQGKNIQEVQNSIRSNLTSQFEKRKEEFFINQIGGNMVLNPTVDKGIKFFINTLHNISPKKYQTNFDNYNNIQKYFGNSTTGTTSPKTTGDSIRNMINDIMSLGKQWINETKLKGRLGQ